MSGNISVIISNIQMSLILTKNSIKQRWFGVVFFLFGVFLFSLPVKPDLHRPQTWLYLACTTSRNHCPKQKNKLLLLSWSTIKIFSAIKLKITHLFLFWTGKKMKPLQQINHGGNRPENFKNDFGQHLPGMSKFQLTLPQSRQRDQNKMNTSLNSNYMCI